MVEEVINSIIEAEDKSLEIVKAAKVEARNIIANAEEKAALIKKEAIENVKSETTSVVNKAQVEVTTLTKDILDKAEKEALGMKAIVFKNMVDSKKIICKRIEEKYGNS